LTLLNGTSDSEAAVWMSVMFIVEDLKVDAYLRARRVRIEYMVTVWYEAEGIPNDQTILEL
jgi:hypothetical protein